MSRVSSLIVKLSERCNLNCSYCYMYNHVDQTYRNRPPFMSVAIFQHLISRIAEHLDDHPDLRMKLIFHGGEPMLMHPDEFRRRLDSARERLGDRVAFVIQTNATLVSDEWLRVLTDHRIQVGVSLDGAPEVHDKFRVYHDGRGSHADVLNGINRLRAAGVITYGLCVVALGGDGVRTYRYLTELGLRRLDFLIPDVSHDSVRPATASPTPVADYLIPIFDCWLHDGDPDIRIRVFEAIIRSIHGASPKSETIGHGPANYLVIESDGSIHSNDVLKVCETDLSSTGLNVVEHSFRDLHRSPLAYHLTMEGLPIPHACVRCPEVDVCGGGPAPSRYSRARGFDNPSAWCADLLKLITHIRAAVAADRQSTLSAELSPEPVPSRIGAGA